jgi:hypothetical protein
MLVDHLRCTCSLPRCFPGRSTRGCPLCLRHLPRWPPGLPRAAAPPSLPRASTTTSSPLVRTPHSLLTRTAASHERIDRDLRLKRRTKEKEIRMKERREGRQDMDTITGVLPFGCRFWELHVMGLLGPGLVPCDCERQGVLQQSSV